MKNNLYKYLILSVSLLLLCSCKSQKPDIDTPDAENAYLSFKYDDSLIINSCKTDTCPVISYSIFRKFKLNTDDTNLKDIIEEINNKTQYYYEKTRDAKLKKGESCGEYDGVFDYKYSAFARYYSYVNDRIAVVAAMRYERQLCEGKINYLRPEVYVYSFDKKIVLTTEQAMKEMNIGKADLNRAVRSFMSEFHPDLSFDSVDMDKTYVVNDMETGKSVITFIEGLGQYLSISLEND